MNIVPNILRSFTDQQHVVLTNILSVAVIKEYEIPNLNNTKYLNAPNITNNRVKDSLVLQKKLLISSKAKAKEIGS